MDRLAAHPNGHDVLQGTRILQVDLKVGVVVGVAI